MSCILILFGFSFSSHFQGRPPTGSNLTKLNEVILRITLFIYNKFYIISVEKFYVISDKNSLIYWMCILCQFVLN